MLFKKNKAPNVDAPWLEIYPENKRNLRYPDMSAYCFLRMNNEKHLNAQSYSYFGNTGNYSKLLKNCENIGKALKAVGVQKGDVVTICMPNTPEGVFAFYATNMVGAISNMIHPLSAENEIKDFLNLTESKVLIIIDIAYEKAEKILKDTSVETTVVVSVAESMPAPIALGYKLTKGLKVKKPKYSKNVISWKTFLWKALEYNKLPIEEMTGDAYATILYSGGTTGKPKGVILSNNNLNSVAMGTEVAFALPIRGQSTLGIMPIFHSFGLCIGIHAVMGLGGTVTLIPQFNAKEFDNLVLKNKPTILLGVPTLYEAMTNNKGFQGKDLSFIQCVVSGGDILKPELKIRIDDFLHNHNVNSNVDVRVGYGLTECSGPTSVTPIKGYRDNGLGYPFPDAYFKIVSPGGHEKMAYGEIGEICIAGPTVMVGYLNNEVETNQTLQKHADGLVWLHTGDLGYMDEDGYVYFMQRLKRMIISSGYNIYPSQIEDIIGTHKDVLTSSVIAIPHPYKQQVAKAFVVLKEGVKPSSKIKKDLMAHCTKNLSKYSLPHEIEFRESLPKTMVGKVAYRELEIEEAQKREQETKNEEKKKA